MKNELKSLKFRATKRLGNIQLSIAFSAKLLNLFLIVLVSFSLGIALDSLSHLFKRAPQPAHKILLRK